MNDKYLKQALGTQEKIILVTRQHWFLLLGSISLEILMIVVLIPGIIALSFYFPLAMIGLIVLVIPVGSMVRDYLSWSNKRYIVTNRRVIHTTGVLNKNIIDSSLEKVNDVKMGQSVMGRLLNFGTIEILTASELGVNIFYNISNPIHFKTAMLDAKENVTSDEGFVIHSDKKEDIAGVIEKLGQLREKGLLSEEEFQAKKNDLLAKL
jgi:uncharacterized membrane protein YdbT with pleckstrin-like domain